jgi:retron-type reverse transcriptase
VSRVVAYRDEGCRWVLDADIKDCFQKIDHRLLMRFVAAEVQDRQLLSLIKQWLKARIFNEISGRKAVAVGTSQGAVLSPLLANIYLDRFDRAMVEGSHRLVRYADDVLILTRNKKGAQRALKATERALGKLRLTLNPYKTKITHFDEGFLFLGVFFLRNEHFYL